MKPRSQIALLGLFLAANVSGQEATVYHGFTRLDPVNATATPNAFVVVRGDRIERVGNGIPPRNDGWSYVDMSGRYALPGFFDTHAHVTIGPLKLAYSGADFQKNWRQSMAASHFGWTEDDYRRAHAAMPRVLELAKRSHEAGVSLSIGTDGTGGGPSFVRELVLHVQAGIPAWEVLRLATSGAAERQNGRAHRAAELLEMTMAQAN